MGTFTSGGVHNSQATKARSGVHNSQATKASNPSGLVLPESNIKPHRQATSSGWSSPGEHPIKPLRQAIHQKSWSSEENNCWAITWQFPLAQIGGM